MINCIICGKEFIKNSNVSNHQKCCSKKCSEMNDKERNKRYYEENKEYHLKWQKEYYQKNREKRIKYNQKYYQKNKEELLKHNREYDQTLNGKQIRGKIRSKRRKIFNFNPLNVYFESSHAHHINFKDVIYIPEELHRNVGHSLQNNINMESINTIAFFFLIMQNINNIGDIYG